MIICIIETQDDWPAITDSLVMGKLSPEELVYTLIRHRFVYGRDESELFPTLYNVHYHKIVEGESEIRSMDELDYLCHASQLILSRFVPYFQTHMESYRDIRITECTVDAVGNFHLLYS